MQLYSYDWQSEGGGGGGGGAEMGCGCGQESHGNGVNKKQQRKREWEKVWNGKEKKSYLSEEETNKSDYNQYPENTPGVLNIWAHGIKEQNTDNYSWSINVGKHNIKSASDLRRYVLSHSKEWTDNQGKNMTIVLHSCSSSNLAKSMSEDKEFKDKNITIIAPNAKLRTNQGGSIVNSKMYFKNDMKDSVRQEKGEWRAYRDGKLINTLPADAQPGMTDKNKLEQILKEEKKW